MLFNKLQKKNLQYQNVERPECKMREKLGFLNNVSLNILVYKTKVRVMSVWFRAIVSLCLYNFWAIYSKPNSVGLSHVLHILQILKIFYIVFFFYMDHIVYFYIFSFQNFMFMYIQKVLGIFNIYSHTKIW